MLIIFVPDNYYSERAYCLKILLGNLLNLDFQIETSKSINSTIIELPNGNSVNIADHFFSKYKDQTYLSRENIPVSATFFKSDLLSETNLPVFWGASEIHVSENTIHVQGDILASAFFLLSRWEEVVSDTRDGLGRFPDSEAYLIKNGLNLRPIVNEYAYFILNCLNRLHYNFPQKHLPDFKIVPTHDVDKFRRFNSRTKVFRALVGDLYKRKSFRLAQSTLRQVRAMKKALVKDPFDTFSQLMDYAESANVKAKFFFMPGEMGEQDVYYDINDAEVKKTVKEILERGHLVGIHPGMSSFLNQSQLLIEINRLKQIGVNVTSGRQHYLRYRVPDTWRIWDTLNLNLDYGMSYHESPGFRCGIANAFPAFDVLSGEPLDLKLMPTVLMDQALLKYCKTPSEFKVIANQLKAVCKKYHAEFVFLWHPENINTPEWQPYSEILKDLYQ
ncbi:MAG: polysaccharide deacetylase family protein [Bacteroidales bacterium]|jgi:hypothetical protein|nr:polysaccharide deacetylase family protein [Bacteroidales bacterium]